MPGPLPPPAISQPSTQPVLQLGTLPPAKSGCQGVESVNRSCVWVGEIVGGFFFFLKSLSLLVYCLCFLICLSWAFIELVPRKYF